MLNCISCTYQTNNRPEVEDTPLKIKMIKVKIIQFSKFGNDISKRKVV